MARQELEMSPQAEEKRLELLWDAYKAQEDELVATKEQLEKTSGDKDGLEANFHAETERLQKLWDAFRAQEDELTELKEIIPLMEEKLVERERTITSLQRDISLLEPLTKKGKIATDIQRENDRLNADVEVLEARLKAKGDEAKPSRDAPKAHEVKELQADLKVEKDRLEKLYSLYQDQESELESSQRTVAEWESWAKKTGNVRS